MKTPFQLIAMCLLLALTIVGCSEDSDIMMTDTPETGSLSQREQAIEDYKKFKAKDGSIGSVGSVDACDPGSLTAEMKENALKHIKYYRRLAGVHDNVTLLDSLDRLCQHAALMMVANRQLNHYPDQNWKCYSEEGRLAAGKSNLNLGSSNVLFGLESFVRDPGTSNDPVGHRRWLLFSRAKHIGVGTVKDPSHGVATAHWVIGNNFRSNEVEIPEFIAWPPADYVVRELVYPKWSFAVPHADFAEASVSMIDESGAAVSLDILHRSTDKTPKYGDQTIVWRPNDISTSQTEDNTYTIRIDDVIVDGGYKSYEYQTIVINSID